MISDRRAIGNRRGADYLHAARYPTVRLSIDSVTTDSGSATAHGALSLHGVERSVEVPVEIDGPDRGVLAVRGTLRIRQTRFGIEPESIAGVVNVADAVDIVFRLVAIETGERCEERPSSVSGVG